jgi:hypothetical protein
MEVKMWNPPNRRTLAQLPRLYETEKIPLKEKIVHMHFFIFGCDWYAAEYDGEDRFFGYVILNGDYQNAEWGYFSLSELTDINHRGFHVECDQYWKPQKAGNIHKIRRGNEWEDSPVLVKESEEAS